MSMRERKVPGSMIEVIEKAATVGTKRKKKTALERSRAQMIGGIEMMSTR